MWLAQRQGAAPLVAHRDAGTDVMTSTARELLADATYRTNAGRIARIYAAADGSAAAAQAISALASTTSGSASGAHRPPSRPPGSARREAGSPMFVSRHDRAS